MGQISTKLTVSRRSPLSLRNSPSWRPSPIGRDGPELDLPRSRGFDVELVGLGKGHYANWLLIFFSRIAESARGAAS
jgi:hypothetical protein